MYPYNLTPKSFVWEDGSVYEIQRIKDVRRAASLKAGGVGQRYTCVVDGREVYLSLRTPPIPLADRMGFSFSPTNLRYMMRFYELLKK